MATVPRPHPHPARRSDRHLRVIPGGRKPSRAGSRRTPPARRPRPVTLRPGIRFAVAATIVIAAFVFGLVLLHVLLAQSAFRLQSLEIEAAGEEARYRQMRYQVATAEAPARVAEAAAGIGLVVPEQQRYLLARGSVGVAGNTKVEDEDRSELKALLQREP